MFNLTLTAPKNVNEATAQALRFTRAQILILEGYTFSPDEDLNCIYVCKPGKLSFDYIIHGDADNLSGKAGCTCPDMTKSGQPCKHYIAAYILQQEAKEVEAYETAHANNALLPASYGG